MQLGINLGGANWHPTTPNAVEGKHYFFATPAEIDYFAAKGFTNIRLPLAWERLQPQLNGELNADYLARMRAVVEYAESRGLTVTLDIHNYGAYNDKLIGTPGVPTSAFADLWGRLASEFIDNDNVVFGLMNEPQQATAAQWLPIANAAIAAIREAGATQQIAIPGAYWTGGHRWTTTDNAKVFGEPGAIVDPAGNYVIEIHQYLDNGSGQNDWVVSETIGVERLTSVTQWARAHGMKLYLGEFGVSDDPTALVALRNMLEFVSANADVWQGAAYWAAGRGWGDYSYAANPALGLLDSPQMDVLELFASTRAVETRLPDGGHRVDTYVPGQTAVAMTDILDAEGNLVSRSLYDKGGNLQSQVTNNPDGTYSLLSYADPAKSDAHRIEIYDTAMKLVERTDVAADGSFWIRHFTPGNPHPFQEDSYNADGVMLTTSTHYADTHTIDKYVNGVIYWKDVYSLSWKLLHREYHDAQGRVTLILDNNPDGTRTRHEYNVQTGELWRVDVQDADGALLRRDDFDVAGLMTRRTHFQEHGVRVVETFALGSHEPTGATVYLATNQILERWIYEGGRLASIETQLDGGLRQIDHFTAIGSNNDELSDLGLGSLIHQVKGAGLALSHRDIVDGHDVIVSRAYYDANGALWGQAELDPAGGYVLTRYPDPSDTTIFRTAYYSDIGNVPHHNDHPLVRGTEHSIAQGPILADIFVPPFGDDTPALEIVLSALPAKIPDSAEPLNTAFFFEAEAVDSLQFDLLPQWNDERPDMMQPAPSIFGFDLVA